MSYLTYLDQHGREVTVVANNDAALDAYARRHGLLPSASQQIANQAYDGPILKGQPPLPSLREVLVNAVSQPQHQQQILKPDPLPTPVWNWNKQSQQQRQTSQPAAVKQVASPSGVLPIPQPVWNWNQHKQSQPTQVLKSQSTPQQQQHTGAVEPIPVPVWNWKKK